MLPFNKKVVFILALLIIIVSSSLTLKIRQEKSKKFEAEFANQYQAIKMALLPLDQVGLPSDYHLKYNVSLTGTIGAEFSEKFMPLSLRASLSDAKVDILRVGDCAYNGLFALEPDKPIESEVKEAIQRSELYIESIGSASRYPSSGKAENLKQLSNSIEETNGLVEKLKGEDKILGSQIVGKLREAMTIRLSSLDLYQELGYLKIELCETLLGYSQMDADEFQNEKRKLLVEFNEKNKIIQSKESEVIDRIREKETTLGGKISEIGDLEAGSTSTLYQRLTTEQLQKKALELVE